MKKTLIVTTLVILSFWQSEAYSSTVKFSSVIKDGQGNPVQVTIELADGEEDARKLLQEKSGVLAASETRIMVADVSAATVAETLGQTAPLSQQALSSNSIAFFEVDEVIEGTMGVASTQAAPIEETPEEKRREKIHAIAFATAQTAVATTSFIFLSGLPLEPAIASATLAGFFNFYFNLDIERWDKFQRWGRDKIQKGVSFLGKESATHKRWFNKVTKSITGYVGRIGFSALYTGVALWQSFANEFLTLDTMSHVGVAATIGALMAQPFDTTLGDWLENGHNKLSKNQVKLMIRLRGLVAVGITPLIYIGNEYAYAAGLGMFGAGMMLMVYDQLDHIQEKLSLGVKFVKKTSVNYWSTTFKRKKCDLLLSKELELHDEE